MYMFSYDTLQALFSKLVETAIMHQYRNVHPKDSLRRGPPSSRCSGTAPVTVINSKFSGNMPSLVLGKVMKFQHPSSSRFGDILEKPEGG